MPDTWYRWAMVLTAWLVLAGLAILVWPTPYRDLPLRAGSARILAARQMRVTGRVEVLTAEGWHPLAADTAAIDPLVARALVRDSLRRAATP